MQYKGKNEESFVLQEVDYNRSDELIKLSQVDLAIVWFLSDNNELVIDNIAYNFCAHQMLFLTEFHKLDKCDMNNVRILHFNRSFYCIKDHDSEVSCKGLLFFGASTVPYIHIPMDELEKFQAIWKMLKWEMATSDNLQLEMLQSMLKRLLIMCTRIYKSQNNYESLGPTNKVDIIREFNFLVERHFKTKNTVAEYADILNKSPKTLSNLFSKLSNKTPLQFIQDRRMLEARRLLSYTDKRIKEIAYEIGFDDIQSFSRFFKKIEGVSPSEFREKRIIGNIAYP